MGIPSILGVDAEYSNETANSYNEKVSQEVSNKEKNEESKVEKNEAIKKTEVELENLKILSVSKIIEDAIYDEKVTKSAYQFTNQETYTNTDFNDKTDTYVNMNTSFRYIRYNIGGAGTLYNQLNEGNNFAKDSPKKIFETIKNRFIELGFNKKINGNGKLETFEIQNDQDILYLIGFFQAMTASKKDFRIGPKTLTALLDNNNTLTYTPVADEETTPKETVPTANEVIPETNEVTTPEETVPTANEETDEVIPTANEVTTETDEETDEVIPETTEVIPETNEVTTPEETVPTANEETTETDEETDEVIPTANEVTGINKDLETRIERIKMPTSDDEIINDNYSDEDKKEAEKTFEAYRQNLAKDIEEIEKIKTETIESYNTYMAQKNIYDKISEDDTREKMTNDPKINEMNYNGKIIELETKIDEFETKLSMYEKTKKEIEKGNAISGNINGFKYDINTINNTTEENNEIKIDNYFYPTTDWTEHIAPRIKSENRGNRMTKEHARNRTDRERNKDSEKFIENRIKEDTIIIDIGSALGNKDATYAGITVQELYENDAIKEKTHGNIIATDLNDRGNKETRNNHVKNKSAYNIKVERVDKSLGFMTPVKDIVNKYGTNKSPIIIRAANSIDMLMTQEEALKHFQHIANSLKNHETTYIFNKYILYKPANSTKFSIIGDINEAGFDHNGIGRKTNKDRIPYNLNQKGNEIKETIFQTENYPEFEDMETNLNKKINQMKESLKTTASIKGRSYTKFSFVEEKKSEYSSTKIMYDGILLIEIGTGIYEDKITYFNRQEENNEKTWGGTEIPNNFENKLLGIIIGKMDNLNSEYITKNQEK